MMFDFDFFSLLMLLQDGPPPGGPGEGPAPGLNGDDAARQQGLFPPYFLLLLLGMIVVMILISVMGQRRERKKREELISSIKKHDKVQTIGGVIGSIVEVKPDTVVLKVDESSNTRITFARSAIQQVIKSAGGSVEPEQQQS